MRGEGGEGEVPDPLYPRLQPWPPAQQAVSQELLTVLCTSRDSVSIVGSVADPDPGPF